MLLAVVTPSPSPLSYGHGPHVLLLLLIVHLFCSISDLNLNLKEQRVVPGLADQDPWILKVWALRGLGMLRREES